MIIRKVADRSGSQPKKGTSWPLDHIEIPLAPKRQGFSPKFLERAITEGWATRIGTRIVFDTKPKTVYDVIRLPGCYCCHCGIQIEAGGTVAQIHVKTLHPDKLSPDKENPAGYRINNYYDCKKEE